MKNDFNQCLKNPVGFKGYNIAEGKLGSSSKFVYDG
jgi:hypothetical protein